jgi:glycosyltransferase involved in cell wall biosynthesis
LQTAINKIGIVIPVYNEITSLPGVVEMLLKNPAFNIIIIDDGSSENIPEAILPFPVIYIRHRVNLGQGAALQTGFDYCRKMNFDAVVTFDGDGQHDSKDAVILLQPVLSGESDIVFGSRFLEPGQHQVPFFKKIILQCARIINFVFSGLLLSDAHNGLRALNSHAVQKIIITENGMGHASEILQQVKKTTCVIQKSRFIFIIHNTRFARVKAYGTALVFYLI